MATMKQALELAQKLHVTILSDNGAYKFSPTIRPGRDETVYIHASNAAIQDSKTGLEWRFSAAYRKQYYQVIESSISIHIFPTIPALCGWLENEMKEQEEREAQQKTERAAQLRADKEGVTVYAVRAGQVFFACTYEEIARDHAEDSIQILHTANPTHKPTGEEIASDAKPGDTIVYLNCNGREQEVTYKHHTGSGVIADHPDGWEIGVRFSQIRGLKKSGSTPDLDQPLASEGQRVMSDQEYMVLQQKIIAFDPAKTSTDEILADMATLHKECDRRSVEAFLSQRSRRSVQRKQMIACRDSLQKKLGYRISLNKCGVYARSQWQ